jgi:MFS transporter, AAHS family, 3-hydroxyphenylpropionic acid transporter
MAQASPARGASITVIVCVLAALCEGFDLQAAGVAAAGIGPEFRPAPAQMGTFFSASTFGLFIGALVGGRLADAFGRKRLLVVSVALFGIFSIATGRAWSMQSLIAGRLLTGLGLGGAFPALIALVNELSAPHRRRANVALAYSAMPFGGAVVSLMVMLLSPADWRLIFIAGGVLPLLLTPLMQAALRDSLSRAGAVIAEDPRREAGIEAVAPEDARRETDIAAVNVPATSRFKDIFTGGRGLLTVLLWVSSFLGLLTLYLLLSWLPTLLVEGGFTKTQAAGAQIAFNIGGALAALILGQLLESRHRHASLTVTFVAAPVLVYLLSRGPHDFAAVAVVAFALGGAIIALQGYLYAAGALVYPTVIRGAGMGAAVAAGRTGSIVGPKLGGALKSAGHTPSQLLLDILPLVILGSIAALVFTWRIARRAHADEGSPTPPP